MQTAVPTIPTHPAVCAMCNNGLSPQAGARLPDDFECQRSHDWRGLNMFLFCRWCGRRISPLVLDQFLPLLWEAEGQLWQRHGGNGGPGDDRGSSPCSDGEEGADSIGPQGGRRRVGRWESS